MSNFQCIKDILLQKIKKNSRKYISREFQDYGCRLAEDLDDLQRKTLYIKLAKDIPRTLLEAAKSYVIDYPNAKKKGALFMWKLKKMMGDNFKIPPRKKQNQKKKKKIKK